MKEALYYKKLNGIINCVLCPWKCMIINGNVGVCRVRKNIDGKLYSLVYRNPVSVAVDPIEKKPLYHFLPGTEILSFGTVGCNLKCLHCQNFETSQAEPGDFPEHKVMPGEIVERAINLGCNSIAYTYNEPTIFYEYVLDTAKIARKKRLKNVIVSNGYINEAPLLEWCKYIDGANIDIKGFDENFYRKITTAKLEPVLDALKILKKKKKWIEITNLIIPALNDELKKIEEMCGWIKNNLGAEVPLHFTAFYPTYKLTDKPRTSTEILLKARDVALKTGLKYVYVGNVYTTEEGNTYCPKCKSLLIERNGFSITQNNVKHGKCFNCSEKIAGVWE